VSPSKPWPKDLCGPLNYFVCVPAKNVCLGAGFAGFCVWKGFFYATGKRNVTDGGGVGGIIRVDE